MYNQYYQSNYNQNNSYNPNLQPMDDSEFTESKGFLNLLEIGLILILVLILIFTFIIGFFSQGARLRDKKRQADIEQVVWALNLYYENSSLIPGERRYPIAACSGQLNEVDYEFTLRQFLTGQRQEFDSHPYLKGDFETDFLFDDWGVYSQTLETRQLPVRDCPKIFNNIENWEGMVYPDGGTSCNFQSSNRNLRKCYLYTSNISGDKYEIAYFSEAQNAFVIYSRLREGQIKINLERL
jgi:hypothetical protein